MSPDELETKIENLKNESILLLRNLADTLTEMGLTEDQVSLIGMLYIEGREAYHRFQNALEFEHLLHLSSQPGFDWKRLVLSPDPYQ